MEPPDKSTEEEEGVVGVGGRASPRCRPTAPPRRRKGTWGLVGGRASRLERRVPIAVALSGAEQIRVIRGKKNSAEGRTCPQARLPKNDRFPLFAVQRKRFGTLIFLALTAWFFSGSHSGL